MILALLALGCISFASASLWAETATSFPPIAVIHDTDHSYALYASTGTPAVDAAQVWVAAEAACVGAGGHLTSISAVKEEAVVLRFVDFLKNGSPPPNWAAYGNSTKCIWFGYSNLYDHEGNFTDGADVTYIRTKMALPSTGFVNATYFSANAGCAALCQDGAYYFRDCDQEPQAFVCKTSGSTPVNSADATSLTIPASPFDGFTAVAATTGHSIPGGLPYPARPTFAKCVDYAALGNTYCSTTASSISGTPMSWAEAQYFCQASGKGNLATIESSSEMLYMLTTFAPTQSNPALWLGAVKPGFYPAVSAVPGGISTFVQAQSSFGDPTDTYVPNIWTTYGFTSTDSGVCMKGHGCGLALTRGNSGQAGLQYIDMAFRAAVICKAKTVIVQDNVAVELPPIPNDIPQTERSGEPFANLPQSSVLSLNSVGCQVISQQPDAFEYQYSKVTSEIWNSVQPQHRIKVGDVDVTGTVLTACSAPAGRRMLLAGGAINVTVNSVISMPDGLSEADVNTMTAGFAIAQYTGYQSGQFASLFGVTGVAVTQGVVYTTNPPEEKSNGFVIGIAVGLGAGIPILIGLAVLAWWIIKKKKATSAVGPAQVHDEEAAIGIAVADLPAAQQAVHHSGGSSKVAPAPEPPFKVPPPEDQAEEIPIATKPAKVIEEPAEPSEPEAEAEPSEPEAEQEEETATLNKGMEQS